MAESIKRFIEVFVPQSACNLKCSYCYLSQTGIKTNQKANFRYNIDVMLQSIKKSRLGGVCLFNVVADGETMLDYTTMEFIKGCVEEGHFVNIVTNLTLTKKIEEVCSWDEVLRKRIMFLSSFHYIELKRLNLLDVYFSNIRRINDAGCSYYSPMVLCQEYIQCADEIKEVCMQEMGYLPHVSRVRDDTSEDLHVISDMKQEDYYNFGIEKFSSRYMEFERDWYKKEIRSFCYAGDWFFYLNLCTGDMRACYGQPIFDNLFEDPERKIEFRAIGNHCKVPYCYNGISRIPLGVLPDVKNVMFYWQYRNRTKTDGTDTITDYTKEAYSVRLYETNKEYSSFKKKLANKYYESKYIKKGSFWKIERFKPYRIKNKLYKVFTRKAQ